MSSSIFGKPLGRALVKQQPADFKVEEQLRFTPEGAGDHVYLYIQKQDANTEWVQRQLARISGVSLKEIGYAGLKDRHAITRQWFSIYSPHEELILDDLPESFSILDKTRGQKKLKTTAVLGNEFFIRVHFKEAIDSGRLDSYLQFITANGFPNFFGSQRFGREGKNVEKLLAMANGKRCKPQQKSLYLSAGRSFLFNQILNERVHTENWNKFLPGDVAILNNTRSIFPVEQIDEAIQERLERFDIHPALPLYGIGKWPSDEEPRKIEQSVYAQHKECCRALEKFKVQLMPRASRVVPEYMDWEINDANVEIKFQLPAGSFATTLLEQLFLIEEPERF